MRRALVFGLVATLVIVAAVGVALATTHESKAGGSGSAEAGVGGVDASGRTPVLAGDVPPSQPDAKASVTPPAKTKPKPANKASTSGGGRDNNCWDDCGDPGGSLCGSGASTSHGPTGVVDDDGDGDGGDCGEGD
jgi:hypothetical protein